MKRLLLLAGAASILFIIGGGTAHAGTDHSKPTASTHTSPANGVHPSSPAHSSYPSKSPSKPCATTPAPHTSTASVPPETTSPSTKAAPTLGGGTPTSVVVAPVSVQTDIGTAVSTELAHTGPGWLPTAIKFGLMFLGAGIVLLGTAWLGERP